MPNCFTLTRKSDVQAGPVTLSVIDEEMCAYFGEPVHSEYWCRGWYNSIGLLLSLGKNWDEIREIYEEPDFQHLIPVIDFLEANFTTDAWYQYGR